MMKKQNRKKFLLTGLSWAAVAMYLLKWEKEPKKKMNTVKFLTQEGKLVEIDTDKLPSSKQVASVAEVQNWIKK